MSNILFITDAFIKENTPLSQNLDIKDIINNIDPAQDMFIQPILGSVFYNALLLAYSAQTLSADETALVMLIKPALAYRSAELALPFIQYQLKNKGPQTQSGDFSAPVGQTELSYLRNELRNRAEFYETRLDRYLQLNGSLFPLYTNQSNANINPSNQASAYDSDFAMYPSCGVNRCNGFNGFFNTNLY